MQIRPGLSYWWMALPADFSLEPDSPAYRAVRLMAFAALADRLGAGAICVATRDRSLARAVTEWAKATNRRITVCRHPSAKIAPGEPVWRRLRQKLYRAVPPLAAARVLASAIRSPSRARLPRPHVEGGGITFVDYLAHLGPKARPTGEFDSKYWGPLVPLLDHVDEPITWLHISGEFATQAVVSADEALVATFNDRRGRQVHELLHSHLTRGVVARSCLDYARIVGVGLRVGNRRRLFEYAPTGLSLWPIFRASYRDQFYGRTAMLNAFWINMLQAAISSLPHQRMGVYLFENQPWEMALQYSWRRAGHGDLIGVAHTTALFWSTRLFKDPRDMWTTEGDAPMPWPDRVAVNGPLMRTMCDRSSYPSARVLDAEALRFSDHPQREDRDDRQGRTRILVLGEYSADADRRLLEIATSTIQQSPDSIDIYYRPHPASGARHSFVDSPVRNDEHSSLELALAAVDVALCGASSSGAIDAWSMGRLTVVVPDQTMFMSSPAETLEGVVLALSTDQVTTAVISDAAGDRHTPESLSALFNLDESLTLWSKLLRLDGALPGDIARETPL
jgi:surface carbohydrate biosynthesis protein (TIGR04326 family)